MPPTDSKRGAHSNASNARAAASHAAASMQAARDAFRPGQGKRAEPYLQSDVPQAQASVEWRHDEPLTESLPQPPSHWLRRAAFVAGIFTIGAAVGLGAAWWIKQPVRAPVAVVSNGHGIPMQAARSPQSAGVRGPAKGITQSELPYDGAPPQNQEGTTLKAARPEELYQAEQSSGSSGDESELAPARTPPAHKAGPRSSAPRDEVAAEQGAEKAEAKQQEYIARKAARQRAAQRSAKNREIERIQQQAADELKKKTETERELGKASPKPNGGEHSVAMVSKEAKVRTQLARCERNTNFIRREQCKWQLCNGSWGKNGCPSYQSRASL